VTDRHRILIVVLEEDTRSDDIEHYESVLRSIRGVARVERGDVVTSENHLDRSVVAYGFAKELQEFIHQWIMKKTR